MCTQYSFVLVLVGLAISAGCATTSSNTKPTENSGSLVGAWELHADDDKSNEEISHETVFFYPNQQLLIQGAASFRGLYAQD